MSKEAIVQAVRNNLDGILLTTKEVGGVVDTIFEALADELTDGNDVSYPGFGTFKVKDRPARQGRNPQTGEPMQIAASKTVAFKPALKLKVRL